MNRTLLCSCCSILTAGALAGGCASEDATSARAPVTLLITGVALPRTPAEAERAGLDLDSDGAGQPDDQIGFALAVLDTAYPGLCNQMEAGVARLVSGRGPQVISIDADGRARVPLAALLGAGVHVGGLADRVDAGDAATDLMVDGAGSFHGRLGFSLSPAAALPIIRAALATELSALGPQSGHDPLRLDRNSDGVVSASELADHPYVRLLLDPDLDQSAGPGISFGLEVAGLVEE